MKHQFSGSDDASLASAVSAGPTNSVVLDRQGMYYMAGKVRHSQRFLCAHVLILIQLQWKNSGEGASKCPTQTYMPDLNIATAGSSGSPYSTFRFLQDIMSVAFEGP